MVVALCGIVDEVLADDRPTPIAAAANDPTCESRRRRMFCSLLAESAFGCTIARSPRVVDDPCAGILDRASEEARCGSACGTPWTCRWSACLRPRIRRMRIPSLTCCSACGVARHSSRGERAVQQTDKERPVSTVTRISSSATPPARPTGTGRRSAPRPAPGSGCPTAGSCRSSCDSATPS